MAALKVTLDEMLVACDGRLAAGLREATREGGSLPSTTAQVARLGSFQGFGLTANVSTARNHSTSATSELTNTTSQDKCQSSVTNRPRVADIVIKKEGKCMTCEAPIFYKSYICLMAWRLVMTKISLETGIGTASYIRKNVL